MKAQLTITDTDDGGVEVNVEAVEGTFSKGDEIPTAAEGLMSEALQHIMTTIKMRKGEKA
ncbi:MAG: hypothetical protein QGH69_05055 [Alphaproteobacteria bacterium]|jgi:hypothetical protein|nr:hypothetical protein [Alphaproteobacteria bacterium]